MGTRHVGRRLALGVPIAMIGAIGALTSRSTSAATSPVDATVATSNDDLARKARDGLNAVLAELAADDESAALVCPLVSLEDFGDLVAGLAPNGPMAVTGVAAEHVDAAVDPRGLRCEFAIDDNDADSYVARGRVAAIDVSGPGGPVAGDRLRLIDDAPEPAPDDLGGEIYVGSVPFPSEFITYVGAWISEEMAIVLTLDVRASIGDANPSDIDVESVEPAFDQLLPTVVDNLVRRAE